jgi:signal transduction histidine kinase
MALLDARGVIVSVNAAWREAFAGLETGGRPFSVGTLYKAVIRRIVPGLGADALSKAMCRLLAREVHALTHNYDVIMAGGLHARQIRISPLRAGVARFIAVHEDLTEIAAAQAAALDASGGQLLSAQQDERERLAIDLHDSTGPHLAALGTGVSELRRLLRSQAMATEILDDMNASLEEAVREISVLSYLTKPPSLRDGLEASARHHVKMFGIRTGLSTVFRCEGFVDQSDHRVQHAAFRVIQEALSNVHRHAHAQGAEVELASRDEELTLRIADDGKGISPLRQGHFEGIPPGVGITGMRSRVEELGGWLDISSDRAGTVVTAHMPLL